MSLSQERPFFAPRKIEQESSRTGEQVKEKEKKKLNMACASEVLVSCDQLFTCSPATAAGHTTNRKSAIENRKLGVYRDHAGP